MKLAVLCSQVRVEEKLIFQALGKRGIAFDKVDVRRLSFDLSTSSLAEYDVVWIRCVSHTRAISAASLLQHAGVRTVNEYPVFATCGDKVLTTLALEENDVPTPRAVVALSQRSALDAIEEMGYPVVVKSPVGSWGRLMAKVNDREAAEAVLEHKWALSRYGPAPYYIQEYVNKPGRDIRALVAGSETVYAIYRSSEHWITNTARGGSATRVPVSTEIDRLARAAADAVGGGIVAVDLFENAEGALLVNEVNHTPEFHGAMEVTQVDIAGCMVDYVLSICKETQ
jgi:[lysine-biosynthesis-protein LysW]--L-2-aminoadipate ligase